MAPGAEGCKEICAKPASRGCFRRPAETHACLFFEQPKSYSRGARNRRYAEIEHARRGRYIICFTAIPQPVMRFFAWAGNPFPHSVADAVIQPAGGKCSRADHDDWLTPRRFAVLLALLALASYPQVFLGFQTFVYRDFGLFSYPDCVSFAGKLLAWRAAAVESAEQLRHAFPGAMEHPGALSAGLVLSAVPAFVVAGSVLPAAPVLGRPGNVLVRATADAKSPGRRVCRNCFRLQRAHAEQPGLAGNHRRAGLDAVGGVAHRTRVARRRPDAVLAALAGALQMLSGGTEVTLLTWVSLGVVGLFEFFRSEGRRGKIVWRTGLIILLVTGLSAAQLLPFLDLLDFSRRQEGISATLWPMPPSGWANFFVPLFHCRSHQGVFMQANQFWTISYYVGVATVVLALVAIGCLRQGVVWWLAGLAGSCLILALGDATPVYGWLSRHVGVVSLMRFPIKFIILPVFVLPLLAA